MAKLRSNKSKPANKSKLKKTLVTENITNKIIKKRINAEKKITFQKQTLIQGAIKSKKIVKEVQKPVAAKTEADIVKTEPATSQSKKLKPVQKQKQRKKTSISDAKMLLKIMRTK